MRLTSDNVRTIFLHCLFSEKELIDGKPPADAVVVEGIFTFYGFDKTRIESHRDNVFSMLSELPREFNESEGGGWSFLNACVNREGIQWAEHAAIEQLFCLGIGLGLVEYLVPRQSWKEMPGGMPYLIIKKT